MRRWVAVLLVAAVFVTGVAAGGFAVHLWWSRRAAAGPGLDRGGGEFFARRMARELELTPEQREQIRDILDESRQESHALRRTLQPKVRAIMDRSAERIREVLTPEQRREFDRLREEHRRRAERFFLGRGPLPPPFHERRDRRGRRGQRDRHGPAGSRFGGRPPGGQPGGLGPAGPPPGGPGPAASPPGGERPDGPGPAAPPPAAAPSVPPAVP